MDGKVLILSNAAMSQTDSNGRTVAMLLKNYKPEQLAQFYTYGDPDINICQNFYRVTDREALKSFIRRTETGGVPQLDIIKNKGISSLKKIKKTPLKMIMRDYTWKYGSWCGQTFWEWLNEFQPDVVFINLGDNAFLPNLAIIVAKKYRIPVVVFSTEEYAFKEYNYITKKPSLFYWLFNKQLCHIYKKLSKYVSKGYFNTPLLRDEYSKRYSYPCYVAMNSSYEDWIPNLEISYPIKVSYLGNLGINRHFPLIEIANAISEVSPGTRLDVYGRIPNDRVLAAFNNCSNINYCGFVSYDDVIKIIHESTLVVHAESQDPFYVRDLRYAFSTKIADSVALGTPFLIYGNETMAAIDFIKKTECAFICTDRKAIKKVVSVALTDAVQRKVVLEHAQIVKTKYFSENKIDLLEK